tara:strand:- start:488 stop:700 length:213 start_codon:yes stop_codon:yes gene_type:complete
MDTLPSDNLTQLSTERLWDLSAEILTELSRRDSVQYQVKATRESLELKIKALEHLDINIEEILKQQKKGN